MIRTLLLLFSIPVLFLSDLAAQNPCSEAVPTDVRAAPVSKGDAIKGEAGDPRSQYQVALAYEYGCGVPTDMTKAAEWMRRAADQDDVLAQENLGVMYHSGEGMPKDTAEALKWYRLAAKQGNAAAMFNLAVAYFNGETTGEAVRGNPSMAYVWMTLAKEAGSSAAEAGISHIELDPTQLANAQVVLGNLYVQGKEIPRNPSKALQWFTQAANNHSLPAEIGLGEVYAKGLGVPRDDVRALQYFLSAANQGSTFGNFRAAQMYESGLGAPANRQEARKRYEEASKSGFYLAMLALGKMYETDAASKADLIKAYHWIYTAGVVAVRRSDSAVVQQTDTELRQLNAQLTPGQIKKALQGVEAPRTFAPLPQQP